MSVGDVSPPEFPESSEALCYNGRVSALAASDRAALAEITGRLRAALGGDLVEVRLIGSRAEGTARPDSDYDLLVIVQGADDLAQRDRVYRVIHEAEAESGSPGYLQVIALSPEHFQRLRDRELRFAEDADRFGIPL